MLNDLRLIQLQRFAELGRLSATLIHEISNPLSAALINLEASNRTSPAIQEARRNMQILRQYIDSARQQISMSSKPLCFALGPQLDQVKCLLDPVARSVKVKLEMESAPVGCRLFGDPVKLQQIIANLIANAIQAYEGKAGTVQVKSTINDNQLIIKVLDWGKGIKQDELPKIFEPFYTTKNETSHGLGLGLSITKQYVTEDLGGELSVNSSVSKRTGFTITLPLAKAA